MKRKILHPIASSLTALLFVGLLLTGCAGQNAMVMVPPSCQDALGANYHDLTDYEIARLLDDALNEDCSSCLEDCWVPLMKRCLDDGRDIPHRHLVQAVKTFNQEQYKRYFHMAVYRYFFDLSRGRGDYRPVDRQLLRSYCAMLVRNSNSRHDPRLAQAMELCQRLDPGLYNKMFK